MYWQLKIGKVQSNLGQVLSDECKPYHYVKESGSANQLREKYAEKVGAVSKEH